MCVLTQKKNVNENGEQQKPKEDDFRSDRRVGESEGKLYLWLIEGFPIRKQIAHFVVVDLHE